MLRLMVPSGPRLNLRMVLQSKGRGACIQQEQQQSWAQMSKEVG